MSRRPVLTLALVMLSAALAAPARASIPPGGPGPGSGDGNRHHVHRLKPWRARFRYQMERNAVAHEELNARSDLAAQVVKGQWWQIDCQLSDRTQNGTVLWNHIPNVGWVADQAMKTYTDGRLQGSPTCRKPGPRHVWFKPGSRWATPTRPGRAPTTTPAGTAGARRTPTGRCCART